MPDRDEGIGTRHGWCEWRVARVGPGCGGESIHAPRAGRDPMTSAGLATFLIESSAEVERQYRRHEGQRLDWLARRGAQDLDPWPRERQLRFELFEHRAASGPRTPPGVGLMQRAPRTARGQASQDDLRPRAFNALLSHNGSRAKSRFHLTRSHSAVRARTGG